ncbi:unnamed protein product [Prorocentrum cordatum]|uniref:Uncharacterized protein n=1 Tax=Prorocentrum cordatum TaxID=2364126 RepID=A0ABN9PEI9_9DINO|nr:unnamed protein product [Polarella glacialis]
MCAPGPWLRMVSKSAGASPMDSSMASAAPRPKIRHRSASILSMTACPRPTLIRARSFNVACQLSHTSFQLDSVIFSSSSFCSRSSKYEISASSCKSSLRLRRHARRSMSRLPVQAPSEMLYVVVWCNAL